MKLHQLNNCLIKHKERNNGENPSSIVMGLGDYYELCEQTSVGKQSEPMWNGIKIIRALDVEKNYWFFVGD